MHDDASRQVRIGEPRTETRGVLRFDPVVTGEMQGGRVGRQAGKGIEQAVDAFPLKPVSDAEKRRFPALTKISR
jgi:hypothetical protein